jgi:inner membrane protein
MDNLTHSLIGITIAELAFHQSPSSRRPTVAKITRFAFWVVSVVGNNLPDFDVLYAGFAIPGRLGPLLHHRGYTHTLPFILLQGVLLALAGTWWLNRKTGKPNRWDTLAIWGLAVSGPILHLTLDGLNNYGVHPFWPFWNGWIYGDTLFIIEPLLWVALFPIVYFSTKRRAVRWLGETIMVALFTAMWILPITRWYSATAIALLSIFLWFTTRKAKPKLRAQVCAALGLAIIGMFFLCSRYARRQVEKQNAELHPSAVLHDVVLTPYPANPFCFSVLTVETFSDRTRYRMRRGRFSPFPSLVAAADCPSFPLQGSTAYLTAVPAIWGPQYVWEGQYLSSVADMKDYMEYSCGWSGFLKFARAPFLQEEKESIWAGDLRFDYGPELGFAEMEVPEKAPPCKEWIPGWLEPRRDIFCSDE